MVRERGDQDAGRDGQRPRVARGQDQREQLRLVADLGDGDERCRYEKRLQDALLALPHLTRIHRPLFPIGGGGRVEE
ncbi:MAG TPA: hypothetical protein VJO54_00075 [Burkholderiales bacterium]|nr:hypothetical protein [Burkholderiales bacterium]